MTAKRDVEPASGRRIRGLDADGRAQQRRALLLEAALDGFARDGYAGTSIEALCQAAYVGNKAFYEHFSTKEACYLELLQRNTHAIMEVVGAAVETIPAGEEAGTRALLDLFAHTTTDDPRVAIVTFGQSGGISPTIEQQRRANRRQAAGVVLAAWRHFDRRAPGPRAEKMAIAVVGGLFDQIGDVLDKTDYAPAPSDITSLVDDMTDFTLAVRAGLRSRRRRR